MTITKEWLQQTIEEMEYDKDTFPGDLNEDHGNVLEAMKMALAGMEAEPVPGLFIKCTNIEPRPGEVTITQATPMEDGKYHESCFHLYAAPQPLTTSERAELENYRNAQQVVPGDITGPLAHAYKELTPHFMRNHISVFERYGIYPDGSAGIQAMRIALDVMERRGAMQSGAVKDGWVACSDRLPEVDGNYWGWWNESKRQGPVWFIKSELQAQFQSAEVTHWQPLPAAPKQEAE